MDARMKACEECHRALVETTEGNQNFWDQSIQCVDDDENNGNHVYDHATTHCKMLICQDSIIASFSSLNAVFSKFLGCSHS